MSGDLPSDWLMLRKDSSGGCGKARCTECRLPPMATLSLGRIQDASKHTYPGWVQRKAVTLSQWDHKRRGLGIGFIIRVGIVQQH
jgi:hypothetical protein